MNKTNRKLTVGSLKENSINEEMKVDEQKQSNQQESLIEVRQHKQNFIVKPQLGRSLLNVALEQEQAIDFKCKKGTCGKCAVKILQGKEYLDRPTDQEREKLEGDLSLGVRLACQANISF